MIMATRRHILELSYVQNWYLECEKKANGTLVIAELKFIPWPFHEAYKKRGEIIEVEKAEKEVGGKGKKTRERHKKIRRPLLHE